MKHTKLGFLVVLTLALLVAPALAGDCIKLKSGRWHQPGPSEGQAAPTREDYDNSPYTVTAEDYDELTFTMKLGGGRPQKQTLSIDKIDRVFYWPQPQAFAVAADFMNNGDYATAIEKFQAVADDRGARSWVRTYALMNIAAMYEASAKFDGAIAAWEQLIKDSSKSRYVPKAYIQIGLDYLAKGDVNSAKASFGRLARLSGLPEGQKMLGQYYLIFIQQKQGEQTKDQAVLRQALGQYRSLLGKTEGDPELSEVAILSRLGIGSCLVLLGQFDEALAFFQKIADSAKDPAVLAGAYNGLGDCYIKKNQWRDALLCFLRVEILYDTNAELTARALFYSGRCFHFMDGEGVGKDSKQRARQQYGKCASRYPGTKWARDSREANAAIR